MISGKDFYEVLSALVPLYAAMFVAYGSFLWWKIFTPDQSAGIGRFVSFFAVPFLSYSFISSNSMYDMNYKFIAADCIQKVVILFAIFFLHTFTKFVNLEWSITLFSVITLPNNLVVGIPLLGAMYGDFTASLMVQIVVLQCLIWYPILIFLYEYRGAKKLISEQFPPEVVRSIASFRVEPDVWSLSSREPLHADAAVGRDGKLHAVVKRSASSLAKLGSFMLMDSDSTRMEIFSLPSTRETSPTTAELKQTNFCLMPSCMTMNSHSLNEEKGKRFGQFSAARSKSTGFMNRGPNSSSISSFPISNPWLSGIRKEGGAKKELHMFVWSTNLSGVPEGDLGDAVGDTTHTNPMYGHVSTSSFQREKGLQACRLGTSAMMKLETNERYGEDERKPMSLKQSLVESPLVALVKSEDTEKGLQRNNINHVLMPPASVSATLSADTEERVHGNANHPMPSAWVVTKLILTMVWRKLVRNPNTYGSILGLVWSLISFRWKLKMPKIIDGSITLISNAGVGMAMFSIGFFMAQQPKLIACGKSKALFTMALRFLLGPAVIAASAAAIGIRGVLLQVTILQAALPPAIVPFVFARDYDCHADVASTGVIFGMVLALPVTIVFYILLGL